jgi:hypothetical protein
MVLILAKSNVAYHLPQQLHRLRNPFDELVPLPNHPYKHKFRGGQQESMARIFRKNSARNGERGNKSDTIAIEEEGVDGVDEGSGGVGGKEAAGRAWDWEPVVHGFRPLSPPRLLYSALVFAN